MEMAFELVRQSRFAWFVFGMMLGGSVGLVTFALMHVGKMSDDDDRHQQ